MKTVDEMQPDDALANIRADFDRIAALEQGKWFINDHFIGLILRQLPTHLHAALEIGCGTGTLALRLAQCCDQVLGLDLSPESVRIAQQRAIAQSNVTIEVADVQTVDLGMARYDAIVANMVFHLMPLELMLERLKDALAPGGVLVIIDRHHSNAPVDFVIAALSIIAVPLLTLMHTGRLRRPAVTRSARNQRTYPLPNRSFTDIQQAASLLSGAQLRRLLLRRYLLVWRKPT